MLMLKVAQILRRKQEKAQSFVELALALPIILLILLGLVEVAFFIARYLDVMDLTREAARFASIRDPQIGEDAANWVSITGKKYDCQNQTPFNFYYHTACIFSPPQGSLMCPAASRFCNGLNPLVYLDPSVDDVVIKIFTVEGSKNVTHVYPVPDESLDNGYWAFSDHDEVDTVHNGNWQRGCDPADPTIVNTETHYTKNSVESELLTGSPLNKGYVAIEFYYCYHQVLDLPLEDWFVPNPMRIHAYTLMPLPAAQPYPTKTP